MENKSFDFLKQSFKVQIQEFHDVAMNVITLKNIMSPRGLIIFIMTLISSLKLSHLLFGAFLMFYLLDFVTGAIASRIEAQEKGSKPLYWIQSGKIMRGIIKFVVYIQIIVGSYILQRIFVDSTLLLHSKIIPLSIVEVALCVCVASEFVSNLENSKRAKFDIIAGIQGFFKSIWSLINTIKSGKDGNV